MLAKQRILNDTVHRCGQSYTTHYKYMKWFKMLYSQILMSAFIGHTIAMKMLPVPTLLEVLYAHARMAFLVMVIHVQVSETVVMS